MIKEDPDFEILKNSPQPAMNLPATLADVSYLRHPKAEASPEYLEKIQEEINLDVELGLKVQYSMDQRKLLKKDIDTLTKSNEYHQVSRRLLERLFKINILKLMCLPFNLKEAVWESLVGAKVPVLIGLGTILMSLLTWGIGAGWVPDAKGIMSFASILSMILTGVATIVGVCYFIAAFVENDIGNLDFNYDFIGVRLETEKITETEIPIPRMAKLKMKEAKDSGLFEGFTIAYPKFSVEHKRFRPVFRVDPVILGVTKDSRMFMVCWWDIKKDIDRAKTDIRMFRKFKIE
jgi:hypothetical protein